jgi:hypothetical protein
MDGRGAGEVRHLGLPQSACAAYRLRTGVTASSVFSDTLRRLAASAVVRAYVALSVVTVAGVGVLVLREPAVPYHEFAVLARLADIAGLVFWVGAASLGILLLWPERRSGFERFASQWPTPARAYSLGVSAAVLLAFAVFVAGIAAEVALVTSVGGTGHIAAEVAHVLLAGGGIAPFALVMMVAATALPLYLSPLLTAFTAAWANEVAFDRGRVFDGFLQPSPFIQFEEALYWVLPRRLVDGMTREILVGVSSMTNTFPGYDGRAIYGDQLVLVSTGLDYLFWALYLIGLVAAFHLVVTWRARVASRMVHVPGWEGYANKPAG